MPYTDPTFDSEKDIVSAEYYNSWIESQLEIARMLSLVGIPPTPSAAPAPRTPIDPVTGAIELRNMELLTADMFKVKVLEVPQTGNYVLAMDGDYVQWIPLETWAFQEQLYSKVTQSWR